ncbi:hypothetical protein [Rhizobacter sp. Root404]|uniref:hypothetical protein n=1 Tax=Rhizobacter sp. Root404 TaxID=1736528 RepID=UPI0012FBB655|nr:hypothetical protein [Rhizobacter sp. Root404]
MQLPNCKEYVVTVSELQAAAQAGVRAHLLNVFWAGQPSPEGHYLTDALVEQVAAAERFVAAGQRHFTLTVGLNASGVEALLKQAQEGKKND